MWVCVAIVPARFWRNTTIRLENIWLEFFQSFCTCIGGAIPVCLLPMYDLMQTNLLRPTANPRGPCFALWCVMNTLSSIYSCGWASFSLSYLPYQQLRVIHSKDVRMDWSLLAVHNTKHPFLRLDLIYTNISVSLALFHGDFELKDDLLYKVLLYCYCEFYRSLMF